MSGQDAPPAGRHVVVIVDDHPITGAGIAAQLNDAGFHVSAVTQSVEEVPVPFDVAFCDLHMPCCTGSEAVAYLARQGRYVLAISGAAGPQEILDVVVSGAHGYLPKTAPVGTYVRAVRHLLRYTRYVSSELAGMLLADVQQRPLASDELTAQARQALLLFEKGWDAPEVARYMSLDAAALSRVLAEVWDRAAVRRAQWRPTARERELIALIADGCTRKEAAARMSISVMTVSGYLKAIKAKYLASHPDVPSAITPLAAARSWAEESGKPASLRYSALVKGRWAGIRPNGQVGGGGLARPKASGV